MKLNIYALVLCLLLCAAASSSVRAQGCVAVKNMSTCSMSWGENAPAKGWQLSLNYRYFRSYKHFRGKHEEKERVENNTEVINNDNSINLGLNYTINNRFNVSVIIPYIFIDRSSLYEHLGNSTTANPNQERFHTQSNGLGDIRLIGYYNALPSYTKGSVILGLGIKAPTGNYNVKDYFHKTEGLVKLPVDQSIQPGDGGLGIITEVDFSHVIKGKFHGYANALYMLNPRNTNGTLRGNTLTNDASGNPIPLSNEMSVTDQYMLRAGARFVTHAVQASLGGRMECIPVEDLIGKSDGFRRPGYAISIEPSLFYTTGQHTVGFNFPVAVARNRTRSVLDIKRGNDAEGKPIQGDAAFADWLVSVTYAYRLNK